MEEQTCYYHRLTNEERTLAANIHPTAVVEPGAKLGKEITVGPFAYIQDDVEIGDRCVIGPHVSLLRYTRLGENCRVHSGATLGDLPQDVAFKDEESYVRIGDNCTIREGVTIHRGTKAGTLTEVGRDCLLMAYSHLAHNVKVGNKVIISNGALLAGYAEVGDRVFISGNCLVHQFTRIGRLAMLSGGTAIQKDVPPFCITRSMCSNTVMGLNVVGLRRAGYTSEERLYLKRALRALYRSDITVSQAVNRIEAEFSSALVGELCEFVKDSKRGICKFVKGSKGEPALFGNSPEET
ncbi:acyl-ACP--UDP-N-acetylglucosamine O-acyltransferase [Oscillatoria sp. FACHB-1406]|uniref:acyl-ACP--UDP-N-acetylglucosamine O-acyltransferase n=1 Tax=Oscillatoria sp. FACHB-1406 TaxID=2692846 RepID=UPI0016894D34|nr:acyl-ACP--UDP-N-acetylglucosamine O-acyltransferase [Oscillatoria sp. FACHB-1406]MBD2580542.1 acyl-ACP--UDP-N-acetylglucosamine O-acyltransferase [Oscillatoria sp. FACHB-1406]